MARSSPPVWEYVKAVWKYLARGRVWQISGMWVHLAHTKTPLLQSVDQGSLWHPHMLYLYREGSSSANSSTTLLYFCLFLTKLFFTSAPIFLPGSSHVPLNAWHTKPYGQNKESFVKVLGKESVVRTLTSRQKNRLIFFSVAGMEGSWWHPSCWLYRHCEALQVCVT